MIDHRRDASRSVAVVDVHHGNPGGAGVEHAEQRRQTFEGGPVSDRRRYCDHRCCDESGHDARQGAVHSGTDMAPWYKGATPTGMVGVRWVSLDNNDAAYVVLNNINTAKFASPALTTRR